MVEKTNPRPFGTETYVMGIKNEEGKMKVATRENSAIFLEDNYEQKYGGFDPESEESYIIMSNYTSAYVIQSANLAVKIQDEYIKKAGRIDKGVHRQSLWVLWRTAMPSILTELGFLTNPIEEQFLASENGKDYMAKSIFRGIRKYKDDIEGIKKEYNDEIENQIPLVNENVKAGNIPGLKSTDEDDNEDDKEIKKPEMNSEEKKTEEKTIKEKIAENNTKEIPVSNPDSLKEKNKKEDTIVSKKEIADKLKKEVKDNNLKEKTDQGNEEVKVNKGEIVFKVQFASSEVELNLKSEKFNSIVEGSYYKINNVLKYTSGNFAQIKDAAFHQNNLREKGFKDCFVIALKNGQRLDINTARKETGQ